MALSIQSKKPLTEKEKEWCRQKLAEAEPYENGELEFLHDTTLEPKRETATYAKKLLDRGYR